MTVGRSLAERERGDYCKPENQRERERKREPHGYRIYITFIYVFFFPLRVTLLTISHACFFFTLTASCRSNGKHRGHGTSSSSLVSSPPRGGRRRLSRGFVGRAPRARTERPAGFSLNHILGRRSRPRRAARRDRPDRRRVVVCCGSPEGVRDEISRPRSPSRRSDDDERFAVPPGINAG